MFRNIVSNFKHEEAGSAPDAGGGAANIADGAPSAAPAAPAAQPAAGDTAGKSWLESIPEEIRKDPSLQMFKDPGSLAKSWVNAQKMIGADKVVIPGKDATEQDWAAFYNKIGRPESPDKYEIKVPEGIKVDDNALKGFREIAHASGMTAKQVQAIIEWDAQQKSAQAQNAGALQQQELRASLDEYTKTLGGEEKFKATVDKARVAVRSLAPDNLKSFLRESGVGSRPEVIDFFAKLADMMSDDKIRDGTGVPFKNEDPSAIQREIESLEKKMYSDINSSSMASWVEQRNRLYERMVNLRQQA